MSPPLRSGIIPGPVGPLEVLHRAPESPAGAVLLCHPHPLYGGTMHSRVVYHLARAFQEGGWATLRLNFRGVGLSAGEHDEGSGERQDAGAALEHLRRLHPAVPLAVAGYSFGAWVGLQAGIAAAADWLVGVGIPTRLYGFEFLSQARGAVLLIQGDRDRFGEAAAVRRLADDLQGRGAVEVIPGADHSLAGHLARLRQIIQERVTGGGNPGAVRP